MDSNVGRSVGIALRPRFARRAASALAAERSRRRTQARHPVLDVCVRVGVGRAGITLRVDARLRQLALGAIGPFLALCYVQTPARALSNAFDHRRAAGSDLSRERAARRRAGCGDCRRPRDRKGGIVDDVATAFRSRAAASRGRGRACDLAGEADGRDCRTPAEGSRAPTIADPYGRRPAHRRNDAVRAVGVDRGRRARPVIDPCDQLRRRLDSDERERGGDCRVRRRQGRPPGGPP